MHLFKFISKGLAIVIIQPLLKVHYMVNDGFHSLCCIFNKTFVCLL